MIQILNNNTGNKPSLRRSFNSIADELNYLNEMISFWWYDRNDAKKSKYYCKRYAILLSRCGKENGSIMLQDHWALLCEVQGNISEAIIHREREIYLINLLHSEVVRIF
jgi:hypothetical protein